MKNSGFEIGLMVAAAALSLKYPKIGFGLSAFIALSIVASQPSAPFTYTPKDAA